MNTSSSLLATIFIAAATLVRVPLLFPQTKTGADDVARACLRVTRVLGAVEQNYMNPVDPDGTILEGGLRGMLAVLDPFSAFFNRDQFEQLQQQARGEALGFGSILYVQPGKVMVLQAAEGSPSWRAGLGPGDEIVAINGTRLDHLDFNSMIELLQRSRSHPVRLGVLRPGKLVAQDFDLNPAEVALPTVDRAFALSPTIGYIHLSGFEQKTAQEIVDALNQLKGATPSGLEGLLLDLRDNHGGLVDATVTTAGLFLKSNQVVLTVRGRSAPEKVYRTARTPSRFDGPLIVLVNENTASAAEVLAAALQEHDRGMIVGEPTYGKGVVQGVFALSEKTGLALTTAQYFTPSGRSIQRPLAGTALNSSVMRMGDPAATFHTDNGRPVLAGGGITPDVAIAPRSLDPWVSFLNERGLFTTFASEYITLKGKVESNFEPDSKVLNDFKDYLGRGQVRTPEPYWDQDQDYLKLRIKTEVFNLVFGLARGNEVETRGDPQVQKALALFSTMPKFLNAAKGGTERSSKGR